MATTAQIARTAATMPHTNRQGLRGESGSSSASDHAVGISLAATGGTTVVSGSGGGSATAVSPPPAPGDSEMAVSSDAPWSSPWSSVTVGDSSGGRDPLMIGPGRSGRLCAPRGLTRFHTDGG
jgi:hypothetical protein